MIVRQNIEEMDMSDVWGKLSAPVPPSTISWRQDGRPVLREGKSYARVVAYIEANTVRERLDAVVAGEWDLTLDLLPPVSGSADDGDGQLCSFKARLQVMGVIREDVGTGRDYKQAATDAFKRAAVRFGVGHELYAYDTNWVQLDGEDLAAQAAQDGRLLEQGAAVLPQTPNATLVQHLEPGLYLLNVTASAAGRVQRPSTVPAPARTSAIPVATASGFPGRSPMLSKNWPACSGAPPLSLPSPW